MTDDFKKARDDMQSRLCEYEHGLDATRAWQGFVLGSNWAYGWLQPRWTKSFERNHAEIDRLTEKLEALTKEAGALAEAIHKEQSNFGLAPGLMDALARWRKSKGGG